MHENRQRRRSPSGAGLKAERGTRARAALLLPPLLLLSSLPSAGEEGWSLELGGERAGVSLGETDTAWWTGRAQLEFRKEGRGGASFAVEPQRRFGGTDTLFRAGGYRHLGPWTVSGQLGVTPGADFYFRRSAEGELSRRLVGTWVGHAAARFLDFPDATVHLLSAATTWYAHGGEVQLRAFLGRNTTRETRSSAFLLHGAWQATSRVRLGAGAAVGERLFDVTSLAGDPAKGWIVFVRSHVRTRGRDEARLELRLAHEDPSFDQAAVGIYYRRRF